MTRNLHRALLRLRLKSESRTLWIDAVCIDQHNMAERSRQVAMMGRIYRQASCVNVWLGEPPKRVTHVNVKALYSPKAWLGTLLGSKQVMSMSLKNLEKAIDMALRSTTAPWYNRVWIIQEFALAQKVYFCFGEDRLSHDDVSGWLISWRLTPGGAAKTPYFAEFARRVSNDLMTIVPESNNTSRSTPNTLRPVDILRILPAIAVSGRR